MTFGASAWLHLLWAVPLAAVGLWLAARSRRRDLDRLFRAGVLTAMVPAGLERVRAWRSTLVLVGLALAAVAAAQPRWGHTWRELTHEGVELVVAVDLSRSMDAQDVDPSRLERARREIYDLLEVMPGQKVGLVVFAGGAYPRVPLTLDHVALRHIVGDLSSTTLQAQGSSLSSALKTSLDLFDLDKEVDRAILVLSDGESWDPTLDEVVGELQQAEVRVYALAVGTTEGAPIPEQGGGFKTDRNGEVVVTRVQESALSQVASATGGAAGRSVAGAGDVRQLAGLMAADLEQKAMQTRRERVWDERFQWPLAAGIGLLLLAMAVRDPRALAALLLLAATPAQAGTVDEAWRLALSLYGDGDFDGAKEVFDDLADRALDAELAAEARYNAGHAAYQGGELEHALESWSRVLEQHPEHEGAQQNVQAVQQEIAQRMQEEPPEQDQQQDQDQQDQDQDQQDQDQQQGDTGAPQDQQEPQDQGDTGADPTEADPSDFEPAEPQDTGAPEEQAPAEVTQGVGEMSEDEARKLLQAAEEGQPRVVVRGQSGGKDW